MSFAETVKREVLAVDPDQPVSDITTMRRAISNDMASRRLTMTLVGTFAGLALTLAAIGLFGVMALRVTQRTREIGIRLALGAQRPDVFRLIIGNGLKLRRDRCRDRSGRFFGLTRLLSGSALRRRRGDPLTILFVVLLLGGVALLANYLAGAASDKGRSDRRLARRMTHR